MEGPLVEALAADGVESVKINGTLVYFNREFYCKIKEGMDKEAVFKKLIDAGMSNGVMLSYQTLRGLAREWSEADEAPPAVVTECLDLGDVYRLRTRKA